MRSTAPGAFGPVNTCCGITAAIGHDIFCDERPRDRVLVTRPDLEDYALVGNVLRDWVTA